MGWNDEYMIKFFMTSEGSVAFGMSWGYLVWHHDQIALNFTQNFTRASRFRDRESAERCVDELKNTLLDFATHISKVEYMSVRE